MLNYSGKEMCSGNNHNNNKNDDDDDDDEDNRYHNCIPDEKVCLCDYFYLNKLKKMPFTFNIHLFPE